MHICLEKEQTFPTSSPVPSLGDTELGIEHIIVSLRAGCAYLYFLHGNILILPVRKGGGFYSNGNEIEIDQFVQDLRA